MSVEISSIAIKVESKEVGQGAKALDGLYTSADKVEKKLGAVEQAMKKVEASSKSATTHMLLQNIELQKQVNLLHSVSANSSGVITSTAQLTAQMAMLSVAINNLSQSNTRAANSQTRHNAAMSEAHGLARGLAGSMGALWLTYGNVAGMIAGVAIGASIKEIVTGFAKVEYQMTFVKALAEDTTHSVKQLSSAMHDIAGALGIAPEAAAKGLRALTQAGLTTTEALATLPVAFKLAAVGELALEAAALAATGVMNAYGMKIRDLEHIGDVMAKAGAVSAASVDSISVSMKYAAGTADQYGVKLEKLATVLTLLGKRGITGSSAGVAANNLISEIYSPSTEGAIKAQAALGVKTYVDGVRQTLEDTVGSIKEGLKKYDPQSQGILLEAMFGKKGGKAFYAVAQGTKEDFKEIEKTLVESAGFVANVYAENLKTVDGQFKLTTSAIQNMFAKVGEESAGSMKDLMSTIRKLLDFKQEGEELSVVANAFTGLTQSVKTFITTILPLVGILAAVWLSFTVGTAVVGGLMTAFKALMAFDLAVWFAKSMAAGFLLNPIILTILGTITLLGAAYLILKNNKESVQGLHARDMAQSAETIKQTAKEIELLDKKIELRKRGIRGDQEDAALRSMAADDNIKRMEDRVKEQTGMLAQPAYKNTVADRRNAVTEIATLTKSIEEAKKIKAVSDEQEETRRNRIAEIKERDRVLDAQEAAKQPKLPIGTLHYDKNGDKPAKGLKAFEADQYNAKLNAIQGEIESAKRKLKFFEDEVEAQFKKGDIGKLEQIQSVSDKRIQTYNLEIDKLKEKLAIEKTPANRDALQNDIRNKVEKAGDFKQEEVLKAAREKAAYLQDIEKETTQFQIKELEARGEYEKAAILKYGDLNKIKKDQLESSLAYAVITKDAEAVNTLTAALDALNKNVATQTISASFEQANFKLKAMFSGLTEGVENIKSQNTGGIVSSILGAQATDAFINEKLPEIQKQLAAMKVLAEKKDANPIDVANYNKQLKDMDKFAIQTRDVWKEVGESIEKSLTAAFGKVGTAMGGILKASINFNQTQKRLDSDLAKHKKELMENGTADPKKMAELDKRYAKESAEAQIDSYANIAGAAKGLFEEHSTGYKIMEGIERAFHAVKIGMAIAGMAMDQTAAGSSIAASLSTIPAALAAGAAKMFEQLGWFGFIGVAAMVAVMAGFGFGGGSSASPDLAAERQAKNGTGTVLGDENAKSESLDNALKIAGEDNNILLRHTQGMLLALQNIRDSMSGLAATVSSVSGLRGGAQDTKGLGIGSSPGFLGIGAKSTTLIDQGIQFNGGQTVGDIRGGQDISAQAYSDVEKKNSGLWGLFSSTSNNRELKDFDSSEGKRLVQQLNMMVVGIADTVKEGVSALGLLTPEITKMLEDTVLDLGDLSLKGLSGEEVESAIKAKFSSVADTLTESAAVVLKPFQKVGEGLFETLVRVSVGAERAGLELEKFGIQSVKFTDLTLKERQQDTGMAIFKASVNKAEGNSGIGSIVKSSALDNLTDLSDLYTQLVDIRKELKSFGSSVTDVTIEMIKGAGSLDKLASGSRSYFENFFSESEQAAAKLSGVRSSFEAIGIVGDKIPKTNAEFRKLVESIDMTSPAGQKLYGQMMGLAESFDDAAKTVEDAFMANLQSSVDKQKEIIVKGYEAANQRISDSISNVQEAISKLQGLVSALKSTLEVLKPMSRSDAQNQIRNQLDIAKGGGRIPDAAEISEALKTLQQPSDTMFSDFTAYRRDQLMTSNTIEEAYNAAKGQLTIEEQTLKALQDQQIALKHWQDDELARLDQIIADAQIQFDGFNQVDTSVKGVEAAIRDLHTMLDPNSESKKKAENDRARAGIDSTSTRGGLNEWVTGPTGKYYQSSGGAKFTTSDNMIHTLGNASQYTPDQARGYINEMAGAGDYEGLYRRAIKDGISMAAIDALMGLPEGTSDEIAARELKGKIPGFASGGDHLGGWRMVGENGPELEYTEPSTIVSNNNSKKMMDNSEVVDAINNLAQTVMAGDLAIAQNTSEIAKINRRWDGNGIPETRDESE